MLKTVLARRSGRCLILDWETYSRCDLKKCGMYRYAKDASTEVLCLAYAVDDSPVSLWKPGEPTPPVIIQAVREKWRLRAYNAAFERLIWQYVAGPKYGWPVPVSTQWECCAAKSAYVNLPRKLEWACIALNFDPVDQKDKRGHKIMLKLSKPDGQGRRLLPTLETARPEKPAKLTPTQRVAFTRKVRAYKKKQQHRTDMYNTLYKYNVQDVHAERKVNECALPMTEREIAIWRLDQKINDRGVPVDLGLCQGANAILDVALQKASERLAHLTEGVVTGVNQVSKMLQWCRAKGVSEKALPNLRKRAVSDYLSRVETVPQHDAVCGEEPVSTVLDIKRKAGLASVKKMWAAYNWTDDDCRCRGAFVYGAAGTGRWAGRGPQFQNMVRAKTPSDDILRLLSEGDYDSLAAVVGTGSSPHVALRSGIVPTDGDNSFNAVIGAVAGATRAIIHAPPGRKLVISDFAGIEARVLHWLVGDEDTLQRFRDGVDLYVLMAAKIYKVPPEEVTKDQRQIGKIAVLALGYGQGPGDRQQKTLAGFQSSCKNMGGIEVSYDFSCAVVDVYRAENKLVVDEWCDQERAARYCVKTGKPVRCGRVKWRMVNHENQQWLACRLPSGRDLFYHRPGVGPNRFDKPGVYYWGVRLGKYCKIDLYGGLIVENIVQAIARDLLADAMLAIDSWLTDNAHLVMHVHDETVVECDEGDMETEKLVHECMSTTPAWAEGLPIAAETHASRRYEK